MSTPQGLFVTVLLIRPLLSLSFCIDLHLPASPMKLCVYKMPGVYKIFSFTVFYKNIFTVYMYVCVLLQYKTYCSGKKNKKLFQNQVRFKPVFPTWAPEINMSVIYKNRQASGSHLVGHDAKMGQKSRALSYRAFSKGIFTLRTLTIKTAITITRLASPPTDDNVKFKLEWILTGCQCSLFMRKRIQTILFLCIVIVVVWTQLFS